MSKLRQRVGGVLVQVQDTKSLHVKLASDSKLPGGQSKTGNWGVHKGSLSPAGSSGPWCPGGGPRAPAPG